MSWSYDKVKGDFYKGEFTGEFSDEKQDEAVKSESFGGFKSDRGFKGDFYKGEFTGDFKEDAKFDMKKPCITVTGGALGSANTPVPIISLHTGAVAKIPLVLAEMTVQINVDSKIDFPEPIFEIKRIKKRVKVTQCILLQNTNVLFIKGFVRKNIEYCARPTCSNATGFCGDVRQCTIDVPWSITTPVEFNGIEPLAPVFTTNNEFVYFRVQDVNGPEFADKDQLMSADLSEFNQISTEFFNELPFCELISSRIVEFDEELNPKKPPCGEFPFEEREFKSVEEKMVIFLTLKLLQNRQIAIPPLATTFLCKKED